MSVVLEVSPQLPVVRHGLIETSCAVQYEMPSRPTPCPLCNHKQWWELPPDRYVRRKPPPPPSPRHGALSTDPIEPPARPGPPPGWGLVICRQCNGVLVLVLRPMPGIPHVPCLVEIESAMLNFATVQFRLEDDARNGAHRWRCADVIRQQDRNTLDLSVKLHPSDPEALSALLVGVGLVEVRIDDHPETSEPRWRRAIVGSIVNPRQINATAHLLAHDPEGQGFKRYDGTTAGIDVGQWRHLAMPLQVCQPRDRATRGTSPGQWQPINNT